MKRSPLKRGSKPLRKRSKAKSLRDKAWKLQSDAIRQEGMDANGFNDCFTCGARMFWNELDAGHFRHGKFMDFVEKNIQRQCTRCNRFLHGNLGVYAIKLDEKYGSGTAKQLIEISRTYQGLRNADYEKVINRYG